MDKKEQSRKTFDLQAKKMILRLTVDMLKNYILIC